MEQQSVYKKQQKLTGVQFLMELPNFAAICISAILSHSLLVWLDFIDSLGNVMSELLVIILSRKMCRDLRYEYNYGVGKIEAMTTLLCDSIKLCGLLLVIGFSVSQFFSPSKPSDFLLYVVLLKVVNVIIDALILKEQVKIKKESDTYITQSEYIAALSALLFDAVALVSLFCVWIMRNSIVSAYISPVLSIIIAVYLFLTCDKHIRQAISELSDRTLPEEEQLKILKVLTKHDNEYSSFGSIKSRYNGTEVIIDISMSFSQSTTYSEIATLQKAMQQELSEEIENCHISIVIE